MAFDIYGGILRRGHCEVHPEIAEPYPCYICIAEGEYELQREEDHYSEMENEREQDYYANLCIDEIVGFLRRAMG
jgi:hypothetical protein